MLADIPCPPRALLSVPCTRSLGGSMTAGGTQGAGPNGPANQGHWLARHPWMNGLAGGLLGAAATVAVGLFADAQGAITINVNGATPAASASASPEAAPRLTTPAATSSSTPTPTPAPAPAPSTTTASRPATPPIRHQGDVQLARNGDSIDINAPSSDPTWRVGQLDLSDTGAVSLDAGNLYVWGASGTLLDPGEIGSYEVCSTQTTYTKVYPGLRVNELDGRDLCIRTAEGRFAVIRVVDYVESTATFNITVWELGSR